MVRQFLKFYAKPLIFFDERSLTNEEREFYLQAVETSNENVAVLCVALFSVYFCSTTPLLPFTTPPQFFAFALTANIVALAILGFCAFYKFRLKRKLAPLALALQVTGAAVMVAYLRQAIPEQPDLDIRWVLICSGSAVLCLFLTACPSQRVAWKYVAVYQFAALAWLMYSLRASLAQLIVVAVFFILSLAFKVVLTAFAKRVAMKDFKIFELARLREREEIAHEMTLARKIQDSAGMVPMADFGSGVSVATYQKRHDQVGGDWAAIRVLAGGRLIILVADAAGKGLQAALVMHAVQSLWAHSLSIATFDPRAWIIDVNRMLMALGQREAHSVTLGILDVCGDEVDYWSAGHVPLFIVKHAAALEYDSEPEVTPVVGYGSMLGVNTDVEVEVVKTRLDGTSVYYLLLGTDGVIDRGTRLRKREVIALFNDVNSEGEEALLRHGANDDKTLVVVKKMGRPAQAVS